MNTERKKELLEEIVQLLDESALLGLRAEALRRLVKVASTSAAVESALAELPGIKDRSLAIRVRINQIQAEVDRARQEEQ